MDALSELDMVPAELGEILNFLGGDGDSDEILDGPLRYDPTYRPGPTRFSGGSWRVFYASLDWDTAEPEVGYHVLKAIEHAGAPVYYQRFECTVAGDGYDLRPHVRTFPFLTDPRETEAYPSCQALAREARGNGADGLVTLSARRAEGINVPVFVRRALRDPRIVGSAAIIPEPAGYRVAQR
jgi:RES domain